MNIPLDLGIRFWYAVGTSGGSGQADPDTQPERGPRFTDENLEMCMWNRKRIDRASAGTFFEHLEPRRLLSLSYIEQGTPGNADWEAVLVDLDGDGDIDFASANPASFSPGILNVRLNDGRGNFGPPSNFAFPITGFVKTFATGDFNGDGNVDIIIGNLDGNGIFVPGVGDGSFGTAAVVLGMLNARSLWTTDFTGDGIDDIIVDAGWGVLRLAESNRDGTFREAAVHMLGLANAEIVGVADFTGDGIDDIAVFGSGSFQIWTGGGGVFTPGPVSLVDARPAVGDFNGDGIADIAWSTRESSSSAYFVVHIAINSGDGRFDTSSVVGRSTEFWSLFNAQAADLDDDGATDLVFMSRHLVNRSATVIRLFTGDGAGGFSEELTLFAAGGNRELLLTDVQWADTSGDGALDAFVFVLHFAIGVPMLTHSFQSRVDPPVIGSVSGPIGAVTPGALMTITASDIVVGAGRTVSAVRVFEDTNGNGTYDNDLFGSGPDLLFGNATLGSTPGQWSLNTLVLDGQFDESARFFVVATDSENASSDEVSVDVTFWSRIYFPDGWRSDATVTEILSIVNPGSTDVAYRVVVRYETGGRDAVIAQGVLAGFEKVQITLSERGNSAAAIVRGSVGYALEVQSDAIVGASLLREDNFGLPGEIDRVTNAEALNNQSADRWGFADVSTRGNDFLLFYNPFERDIMLRVTFTHATFGSHVIWQPLDALRRSGLNLRQIAALAADEDYAVEITSDDVFAAAISRYADSGGTGFTALGQQFGRKKTFNWVGLGAGESSSLVLFNPGAASISVNIEMAFNDPLATVSMQQVSVAAGARELVSLASFAPAGTTAANMKLTSSAAFYSQATTTSALIADAAQTQSPNVQAREWVFADALFRRGQSDEWLILTNNNSVTTNRVTLNFIVSGVMTQRTLDIGASQTVRINLSDEPTIRVGPDLSSYAIAVSGQFNLVASMVRWDPVGGVGWQTLGTITSPVSFL